jgi:alpha-galactosidase
MGHRILTSTLVLLAFGFLARPGLGQQGAAAAPRWEIRTPPPGPGPKIHGPTLTGCRPGRPFLYRIPCTGTRPLRFHAAGLPAGLSLDADRGILRGTALDRPGSYEVTLRAENGRGEARKALRIVVGDRLALTPPIGWNDWYTHYDRITDAKVREAAHAMVASGMADFGYQYVNIDDCWMVKPGATASDLGGRTRDDAGRIRPNGRFPDMRALTDSIHALGLKAGIYTSPGPLTCAGFTGSYRHEEQDARTFATWGFDFFKYDWCSYTEVAGGKDPESLRRPYRQMGGILRNLDRDMVFNLCQYGMGDVWAWGADVGGHSWRTTGDLGLEAGDRLPGFYRIGLSNARHSEQAGPGAWNDPDYLLIGRVGDARHPDRPPHATSLTGDEQYSYMAMWCLMAAPLIFSGDMGALDPFTLNVLCNAEVIGIDQDELGKQARIVRQDQRGLVLARPLHDGSLAVGLFNLGEEDRDLSVSWAELKIEGPRAIRDLWRQKDLPGARDAYSSRVARHGVSLVRLRPGD